MARKFLAAFYLPKPQPEHAQITAAIKAQGQDVKVIPMGGNTVLYLFVSDREPHVVVDLSRILHNGDKAFFLEISEYAATKEFDAMQGWLNSHRQQ